MQWLDNLVWSSWGPDGAEATGDETVQTSCTPTCANGPQFTNPVRVRVSHPQPPATDTGCPADILFYTDVVITYPKTVPPTEASLVFTEPGFEWTTDNGVTAAYYSMHKPYCDQH
jgi:hypothetical protein